jgi:hypothetical protein
MMQAVRTSETSVNFNVARRGYIPDDSKLHTLRRENLRIYLSVDYTGLLQRMLYICFLDEKRAVRLFAYPIYKYSIHRPVSSSRLSSPLQVRSFFQRMGLISVTVMDSTLRDIYSSLVSCNGIFSRSDLAVCLSGGDFKVCVFSLNNI